MKLSIAIAGALVAGAAATAIPEPDAQPIDFVPPHNFRVGHGAAVPRSDEPALAKRGGMPCPRKAMMGRMGERQDADAASWVPGPLSALLSRLGLDVGRQHGVHHGPVHMPLHPEHHHQDKDKAAHGHHGHHGHHSEEDNVDFSIFVPIARPPVVEEPDLTFISIAEPVHGEDEELLSILPIFGEEDVNAKQEAHRQKLKQFKPEEEEDDDNDDDDDDDDDDRPKHKHHHKEHKHKHKEHKHKHKYHGKHHGKHHKGPKGAIRKMGHKACDMFASLPPHVRAGLSALLSGTVFLALFAAAFMVARRRRMSREERKARRRQRKEARRAAKTAYKAAKAAARNAKEAEAGFALATASDNESEALPSYKDNETDALVERQ